MRGMRKRRRAGAARSEEKRRARPVLEALALPEDAAGGAVRLIALGSSRLMVENHAGLAEVTGTRVRLVTPEGMLAVSGEGLRLTDVRRGALCITGAIREIELPGRREARYD
ncbi:MAG: YabP/YqfC family sporulation protein [Clostridia bacterium]|nr:YabP/YqfC family sporulation protein [Clostridia bacterium]